MVVTIARWTVKEQEISLCQEGGQLIAKCGSARDPRASLDLDHIGIECAIRIVEIFQSVIRLNLEEKICSSSFFPILCKDAVILKNGQFTPSRSLQVALFGRTDV